MDEFRKIKRNEKGEMDVADVLKVRDKLWGLMNDLKKTMIFELNEKYKEEDEEDEV